MLGIPTVLDRFIQQAILQVLTLIFDPHFSESSYGFRPRRNAHDAVLKARQYIEEGYRFVVDIDLEKFFDTVNHDMLMARVARRVKHKRLLKLIRAYLSSGIMHEGGCPGPHRGNTAGVAALAGALQHPTRRTGQGAGTEGTPILSLCR